MASLALTCNHSQVSLLLKRKKNSSTAFPSPATSLCVFIHSHYFYFSLFLYFISSLESCLHPTTNPQKQFLPWSTITSISPNLVKLSVFTWLLYGIRHDPSCLTHSLLLISGHSNLPFPPTIDISTSSQLPQLILFYLTSKWWSVLRLSSRLSSHINFPFDSNCSAHFHLPLIC